MPNKMIVNMDFAPPIPSNAARSGLDFASLYPTVMRDLNDSKLMAELKRLARKRKIEQINKLNDQ